jgi:DNA-binding CsgD family transcriptional regulator
LLELNDQYVRHFATIDPHTEKIRAASSGHWLNYAKLFDEYFVRSNEVYQEFLLPSGLRWSLGARFQLSEQTEAVFTTLRGPRQQPFGDAETRFLGRLNPHLQRATQIQSRLLESEAKAAMGTSALNRLTHPLLIADQPAHALFLNRAAESLVREGTALRLVGSTLKLPNPDAQRALETLLSNAIARGHGGGMTIHDNSGRTWDLVIAPLAPDLGADNPQQRPLAMVLVGDRQKPQHLDGPLLTALFHLTAAEGRVALALLDGLTPEEYAQAAKLSIATVRCQLREIFAKTGTRRQAELVKLLALLPSAHR